MAYPYATVGSLCLKTGVRDPRKQPEDVFAYVDIASIDREAKVIASPTTTVGKDAPSRARKVIHAGDVLVATVRPNLNAVARVPAALHDQIASTGFAVLRPDESRLSSDYLYQWTKSHEFIEQLLEKVRGAQYPAVSDGDVFAAKMPLPPLEEQRRIAHLLDEADRLQRLRKEANEKAHRILPALFFEMFGDPDTNPLGWETACLGELLAEIQTGWSPKCLNRAAAADEWSVLKLGSVSWGIFNDADNKALPDELAPREHLMVKPGDILMSRKNTKGLVGASVLVDQVGDRRMLPDLMYRLRPVPGLDSGYLWGALQTDAAREQIRQRASGAAESMCNISHTRLKEVRLMLPPADRQRAFGVRVNELTAMRRRMDKANALMATMRLSVRQRLFSNT